MTKNEYIVHENATPYTSVYSNSVLGKNYNPDVLACLANLSSDEVFTPPALANRMLDL